MKLKLNESEYNRILDLAGQAKKVLVEEVDEQLQEIFIKAIRAGAIKIITKLLNDPRVDPTAHDNFAIKYASGYASGYGQTEIVRLLLNDPRVDPSANDNDAIKLASEHGHTEIVKLLKKAIEKRNETETK